MKTEELISKYMQINQDEEMKGYSSMYSIYKQLKPPPPPEQLSAEAQRWLSIRDGFPYPDDYQYRDHYNFVRNILGRIFVPRGGYAYRPFHDMGEYFSGLNMHIPQGFKIEQEETIRAWRGGIGFTIGRRYNKKTGKGAFIEGLHFRRERGGVGRDGRPYYNWRWNKQFFFQRYVLLSSPYWDYPDTFIDDVVNAVINDLFMLRINLGSLRVSGLFNKAKDFYENPVKNVHTFALHANLGWFIGEIQLLLKSIRQFSSLIPYPIFVNFGWMDTAPAALIDTNLQVVKHYLDSYLLGNDYFKYSEGGSMFTYQGIILDTPTPPEYDELPTKFEDLK